MDTEGQFLKLVFHQNHANKYNVYNQVTPLPMPTPSSGWVLCPLSLQRGSFSLLCCGISMGIAKLP